MADSFSIRFWGTRGSTPVPGAHTVRYGGDGYNSVLPNTSYGSNIAIRNVVTGAVRIASKSTTAGVVRADTTEEMRAVSDFLRRQFAQLPHMSIGEGNEERLAFAADQKNLRFVAPAPLYSRGAGFIVYTLAAKRTDDGREDEIPFAAVARALCARP